MLKEEKRMTLCDAHTANHETETLKELNDKMLAQSDEKCDSRIEKSKYYGVSVPNDSICNEPLVFTSKIDALAAIKKYYGARFMEFTSYEEAFKYGSKPLPSSPSLASNGEEKSAFRSLTSQQMVALRRTIEAGDEASFLEKVWSNPRYLINNAGDGPTILQEGTRYNALHVVAKFKKTNMCLTILNTIHDVRFVSELYPNESLLKIKDRIKRLVDLYLNTPDKSLSETPLHFACKYGADEILSILLSFPECDISKYNKYGILAREMVCDRAPDTLHMKEKMLLMFEDLFYVPILRDIANNIQEPVIGTPCLSDIVLEATSLTLSSKFKYRKNKLICCAFAGPMSKIAASEFHKVFSKKKFVEQLSCTPEQKKQLIDICLSDSEKGLERVGRTLAKKFGIGWIEYWPKLNFWGDMASAVGLELLESHLRNQEEIINVPCTLSESETGCERFSNLMTKFVDEFVQKLPQLLDNKNKMTFFVLFQSLMPYIFCMSDSSFSEEEKLFLIHYELGHLLYLKLVESNSKGFDAIKLYMNTQFIHMYNFLNRLSSFECETWRMLLCILKYTCYYQSSNVSSFKPPVCDCNWIVKKDNYTYSSSVCYYLIVKLRQKFISSIAFNRNSLQNDKENTSPIAESFKKPMSAAKIETGTNYDELTFKQEEGQSPISLSDTYVYIGNPLTKYCDIHELFGALVDKFCTVFRALIFNYSDNVPFSSEQTFFYVFKQIMPFLRPLCELNYSQECALTFHSEIATTLLSKMDNVAFNIKNKWKIYFENVDFINGKDFDLGDCGITSTKEWMHLFCVIKYVCYLLDDLLHTAPVCTCHFPLDCKSETIKADYSSQCLKELQNMYKVLTDCQEIDSLSWKLALLSLSDRQEEEKEETEKFFTPPESPTWDKMEVFVDGRNFSDIDIDIIRAIMDGGVKISQIEYPRVFSWKCSMESKLGPVLKLDDKLSCTPSSSSASLRRAVIPKKGVRRTLF